MKPNEHMRLKRHMTEWEKRVSATIVLMLKIRECEDGLEINTDPSVRKALEEIIDSCYYAISCLGEWDETD